MTTNTTLVIGGTGKTGHRAAGRLAARGLPVPVGSRSGELPFGWESRRRGLAVWGFISSPSDCSCPSVWSTRQAALG